MKGLTKRQSEIVGFIRDYTAGNGYAPSMRDIGRRFRIASTNGVNDHLRALERKGLIVREDMKARSIRLREQPIQSIELVDAVCCPTCRGTGLVPAQERAS